MEATRPSGGTREGTPRKAQSRAPLTQEDTSRCYAEPGKPPSFLSQAARRRIFHEPRLETLKEAPWSQYTLLDEPHASADNYPERVKGLPAAMSLFGEGADQATVDRRVLLILKGWLEGSTWRLRIRSRAPLGTNRPVPWGIA